VLARQQALATAEDIFERTTCATCHDVERLPDSAEGPAWHVRPVKLAKVWMPKSFFDHGPHENETCTSCHEAEQSESAADVLMPAIDSCRACHGGGEEQVLLASTCIDCHEFHLPQHGLMRPEVPGSVLKSARTDFDRQRAAHRQAERERGR
ncbi:MAG: cytochrome c3 family protein, partial [Pseudomonadales bacterium]